MTNYYDPYDPIFYAQEALIVLENALGMAGRIHRGYDAERKSAEKGSTIEIRKPASLTTQAGATGTVQDLNTEKTTISLNNWREVKFGLTDQELAYTSEQIISEHISPATYALANYIETQLTGLYKYVGNGYDLAAATAAPADIVGARKVIRDNAGSLVDSAMLHFAIDSKLEADFLNSTLFHSAGVAGEQENKDALLRGHLATRFGTEIFVQQTLGSHTGGTITGAAADNAGTVNGNHLIRATTLAVAAFGVSLTIKAGDTFTIAGQDQRYVVTADATLDGAGAGSLSIFPGLKAAVTDTTVVTFTRAVASPANYADAYNYSLMFHRNAFALAMAPLPQIGNGAGARMASILDPRTGLAMRSRVAYDDTNAKVIVTLDVLFGVKCLDNNLACIVRRDA